MNSPLYVINMMVAKARYNYGKALKEIGLSTFVGSNPLSISTRPYWFEPHERCRVHAAALSPQTKASSLQLDPSLRRHMDST